MVPFNKENISMIVGMRNCGLHVNFQGACHSIISYILFNSSEKNSERKVLCKMMFNLAVAKDDEKADGSV